MTVAGKSVHRRSYRSPERHSPSYLSDGRQEGLDHDRAVVTNGIKSSEDLVPRHVTAAWCAPVVLCDLHVEQPVSCPSHCLGKALLLDVHVEGVQEEPDVRPADPVAQVKALFDRVHEVCLEPVQGFHRQTDPSFPSVVSRLAQTFYGPGALLFTDRKSTRLNSSHLGISYA